MEERAINRILHHEQADVLGYESRGTLPLKHAIFFWINEDFRAKVAQGVAAMLQPVVPVAVVSVQGSIGSTDKYCHSRVGCNRKAASESQSTTFARVSLYVLYFPFCGCRDTRVEGAF